jgi:hypothetical protein
MTAQHLYAVMQARGIAFEERVKGTHLELRAGDIAIYARIGPQLVGDINELGGTCDDCHIGEDPIGVYHFDTWSVWK